MRVIPEYEKTYYLEKWVLIREKKWRYVIRFGVFYWALPAYTAYVIMDRFILNHKNFDVVRFCIGLITWSVCGIGYGFWFFRVNEKRYKRVLEAVEANSENGL